MIKYWVMCHFLYKIGSEPSIPSPIPVADDVMLGSTINNNKHNNNNNNNNNSMLTMSAS